ncbi:MAG: hypothetical protein COT74_12300 [Bdellovibrionales bacterium CG10_big_fil_rev_8_21_14_0_10_45_34]|nr:MAG: hypothetical protein COT74_12300 [Bdellovibrionales bacterium CG10_big_fil_rev_8_21_14_0_10_45_34]
MTKRLLGKLSELVTTRGLLETHIMTLYFFNLKSLIEELKKSDPAGTFKSIDYLVMMFALQALLNIVASYLGERGLAQQANTGPAGLVLGIFVVVVSFFVLLTMLRSLYSANGGSRNFFERLISILFVVSNRVTVVYFFVVMPICFGIANLGFGLFSAMTLITAAIGAFIYAYYQTRDSLEKLAASDSESGPDASSFGLRETQGFGDNE